MVQRRDGNIGQVMAFRRGEQVVFKKRVVQRNWRLVEQRVQGCLERACAMDVFGWRGGGKEGQEGGKERRGRFVFGPCQEPTAPICNGKGAGFTCGIRKEGNANLGLAAEELGNAFGFFRALDFVKLITRLGLGRWGGGKRKEILRVGGFKGDAELLGHLFEFVTLEHGGEAFGIGCRNSKRIPINGHRHIAHDRDQLLAEASRLTMLTENFTRLTLHRVGLR